MEVVFRATGNPLAVLDPNEIELTSGKAVKQALTTASGVCRFRQRLFLEDGTEIQDDEIIETAPAKVQLVKMAICPPDAAQSQQMFASCRNRDSVALEKLLRCTLQPNVTDEQGQTLVHEAARQGDFQSIQLLLEAGASTDQCDNDGWTPLHVAAENGHVDAVRYLVESGSLKDQGDNGGATPIQAATQNGHVEVVRYLNNLNRAGAEVGARKRRR